MSLRVEGEMVPEVVGRRLREQNEDLVGRFRRRRDLTIDGGRRRIVSVARLRGGGVGLNHGIRLLGRIESLGRGGKDRRGQARLERLDARAVAREERIALAVTERHARLLARRWAFPSSAFPREKLSGSCAIPKKNGSRRQVGRASKKSDYFS
ncbi:MAG: hypothetical protein U0793_21335 [Gemmataceae bacterium]